MLVRRHHVLAASDTIAILAPNHTCLVCVHCGSLGIIRARFPDVEVEIKTSVTEGDLKLKHSLATLAATSPGLFTKELETWLQAGVCDAAVHSLKDVPTQLPPGLAIAAISKREDPRDVLIVSPANAAAGRTTLASLPAGALIGTSSLRRQALLRRCRKDLRVADVRGNLQTRLAKLDTPESFDEDGTETPRYDALVLAAAGVKRLGWWARVGEALQPASMAAVTAEAAAPEGASPAAGDRADEWGFLWGVGQGALAVEVRQGDAAVAGMVRAAVEDGDAAAACVGERAMLRGLLGGCQVPIAAASSLQRADGSCWLRMEALVAALDGSEAVHCVHSADLLSARPRAAAASHEEASALGTYEQSGCHMFASEDESLAAAARTGAALAGKLLAAGAAAILGDRTKARPISYGKA